jgi:cell division protease FtsH
MDDEEIFDEGSEGCIDMSDELADVMDERQAARHEKLQGKNKRTLARFLGKGARSVQAGVVPGYYGSLLIWALKRVIEAEGWEIIKTLGYHTSQPTFIDVQTDYQKNENLLQDGQMLLKKGELRLIVTVSCTGAMSNSVLVEGNKADEQSVKDFTEAIEKYAAEHNFYRGKRIEFSGILALLDVEAMLWDSIVLDEEIKDEIRANTVDFLRKCPQLEKYGIPTRRGIVLAGEPGTGKTIICRALMSQAENISCITANAYLLTEPFYISQLYELAADLSPCIVFIEDVDFIGQDRFMHGFHVGAPLLALLNEMDGIEKQKQIVTVATTNGLETLDKALCERPSRFDRVIKLNRPTGVERSQIVGSLCARIPLAEEIQNYIARRTDGFTPAQLQEVVFGLVIDCEGLDGRTIDTVSQDDVDRIIGRINGRKCQRFGFNSLARGEGSAAFLAGNQNKTSPE